MNEIELQNRIYELELELKNLKDKENKKSYGFSSINDEVLFSLFDVERIEDKNIFNNWFDQAKNINLEPKIINELESLILREENFIFDYQEEDLKIYFIAPILNLVDFRLTEQKIRGFFEQKLTYSNSKAVLNGTVDFVVAKGRKTAIKPYFFIQEFKQKAGGSDPEPQLVAELISAVELNNWHSIKGAFIIGNDWKFVILEKLELDKYKYFVSRHFDSIKIEDLKNIYKNLLVIKNEVKNID